MELPQATRPALGAPRRAGSCFNSWERRFQMGDRAMCELKTEDGRRLFVRLHALARTQFARDGEGGRADRQATVGR